MLIPLSRLGECVRSRELEYGSFSTAPSKVELRTGMSLPRAFKVDPRTARDPKGISRCGDLFELDRRSRELLFAYRVVLHSSIYKYTWYAGQEDTTTGMVSDPPSLYIRPMTLII